MSERSALQRASIDCVVAFQFLTRLPMSTGPHDEGSLVRALAYFPLVGLALGGLAAGVNAALRSHLGPWISSLAVVVVLVLLTGALHEDGLADTADGFGGGRSDRARILEIFRDSRIGSYGAIAIALSLLARVLLIAALPQSCFAQYVIAAAVLCRWSSLPLSAWLPPARAASDGQGARIAQQVPATVIITGSALAFVITTVALRRRAIAPLAVAVLVSTCAGFYFRQRLGGVTGDCFGAANQLVEIAVLCCGAWHS